MPDLPATPKALLAYAAQLEQQTARIRAYPGAGTRKKAVR